MSDEDEEECYFFEQATYVSCEGRRLLGKTAKRILMALKASKLHCIYTCTSPAMCVECGERVLSREIFLGFECTKITVVVLFWPQKKSDKLKEMQG